MTEAFVYAQSDGYEVARDRIMGRQVAGRGFMTAILAGAPETGARFLVPAISEIAPLETFARAVNPNRAVTVAADMADPRVEAAGAVSYFDVSRLVDGAWRRRTRGLRLSLVGLTHSISDPMSMDLIAALARAPVEGHDALICTSRAIKAAAARMFEAERAYLAERHGAALTPPWPDMPVIPLGIDAAAFAPADAAARRADWRARLGIGPEDVVALFFGRIAFHAKAHPLPMYVGLDEAARATGRRVHLIQAGWFPNLEIERAFRETGAALAPGIVHHVLDGRDEAVRRSIWFAADFFTSLSDTIEESFGLTPLEAMAAGLPVVASDWDGYRDTVINGATGFLVPTLAPPPGVGADIARLLAEEVIDFDSYEGFAGLATAVDVAAARSAYEVLIGDDDRRQAMGAEARAHVRARFTWDVVAAQHRALWADLAARRAHHAPPEARLRPSRLDPYDAFAGHATGLLGPGTTLVARRVDRDYVDRIAAQHMNVYGRDHVAPNPVTVRILGLFEAEPRWSVADILARVPDARPEIVYRSVGWLAKMGFIARA